MLIFKRRRRAGGGKGGRERGGQRQEQGRQQQQRRRRGGELGSQPPRRLNIIVVGSSKGGVGKSLVAANLAVALAVYTDSPVAAVDADLDNMTLSERLPPHDFYKRVSEALARQGETVLSFADFLVEGVVPAGRVVPVVKDSTRACTSDPIEYRVRLVPALDPLRLAELRASVQGLDAIMLRSGVDALIEWLRERGYVAVIDAKQKSNLGINYEPLYSALLERADVFILVTEPPYLGFSDITAPYTEFLSKTVIVVNKVLGEHVQRVALLMRDAAREGVPVHIIPHDDKDAEVYVRKLRAPAADSLARRTAIYVAALAARLRLLDWRRVSEAGCAERVQRVVQLHEEAAGGVA